MNRKTGIFLGVAIIFALVISVTIATLTINPNLFTANVDNNVTGPTPTFAPADPNQLPEETTPSPQPSHSSSQQSSSQATVKSTPAPVTSPTPTLEPTPTPTLSPTQEPTITPTPAPTSIPTPKPHPTVDPASIIFSDDFNSGGMSAWTSTDISGVKLGVVDSMLECSTSTATNGQWGYVYEWLNQSYDSLNWRWYLFFGDLPTTDGNVIGGGGMYNSAIEGNFTPVNGVCAINVVRINGECYWNFAYVDGDQVYSVNSTQTVAAQTWYLVELKGVQANGTGEVHCYVNDEEILNATNLTNNYNSGIDHVSVGGGVSADKPIVWYCASAIASTEHIGPKPSEATAAFSTATNATSALAGISLFFGTTLTTLVVAKNRTKLVKTTEPLMRHLRI